MMYSNLETDKRDGARDGFVTVQATPAGTVAANPQGGGYYNAQGKTFFNYVINLYLFLFIRCLCSI